MTRLLLALLMMVSVTGCKRNPVDRLTDPNPQSVVPYDPTSPREFMIFDDEITTGGGLGLIPGGDNQSIDVTDHSSPRRSTNALRYQWNGQDVFSFETGQFQHLFAGFNMFVASSIDEVASSTPKNLSGANYANLKFFIRGQLSPGTTVRIQGPDDGAGGITPALIESGTNFTLTNDWQEITMTIPSAHFTSVRIFLTITLQYAQAPRTTAPGNGGVIYLDDIRYGF